MSKTSAAPTIIRILIVEDQELVRISLRTTIELHSERFTIIGEAINGQEAIELAQEHQPDIILMDIGMPIIDGITATQKLKEQGSLAKVIMLTTHESDEDILDSFRSGATSYCLKETPPEELSNIITSTANGASWIDPKIARVVITNSLSPIASAATPKVEADLLVPLTPREKDVLKLITEGKNNSEISEALCLSPNTIKSHIKNLFQKLDVKDRTAAALKALREQLV